ncbi:MAG: hypothetical protein ACFFCS_27510 [Candidatus Hodarchaeota archaeon]
MNHGYHPEGSEWKGEYLDIGIVDHPELDYLYSITTSDISHLEYNDSGKNRKDEFIKLLKENA